MKVLFICKGNAGRSQVAEGIFNKITKGHEAVSAGTDTEREGNVGRPPGNITCSIAYGLGYDISKQRRKQLTKEIASKADKIVVLMIEKERSKLPEYVKDSLNVVFWNVKDMKGMSSQSEILKIEKRIEKLVKKLSQSISAPHEKIEEKDVLKLIRDLSHKLPAFDDGRVNYTNTEVAPVITIFIEYKKDLLLLRRSRKVLKHKGLWDTVSGYYDEIKPIRKKALEEVAEETGITKKDVSRLRKGAIHGFYDKGAKRRWVVCPVLITLKRKPKIKLDFENVEYRWISKKDMGKFDTIPGLAYDLRLVEENKRKR